jgi:ubiquinone/menaquinone biosynthesis C-methylase UbiE
MSIVALALLALWIAPQEATRNTLQQQYKDRTAAAMAEQFESPSRPVYQYRVAIASMLQLKPGMTAAEIGAGSGFLARLMAQQVGPTGRVFATELEPKMVAFMAARAKTDGLTNFTAVQARPTETGLEPASVDAMAIVNTFSFFDKPAEMAAAIAAAIRPGGLLVVVDFGREGQGASVAGIDADEVVSLMGAAGFDRLNESGVVPGQYAVRFRKR